jgi:hypothetical protein
VSRELAGRSSHRFSTAWIVTATVMALALSTPTWHSGARGDEPPADATPISEKDKAEKRMKFMLQALERYEVVYPGDPPQTARLHPKPLLRWTNPVTTIKDGTLAVYTRGGRPDVVVEFQVHNEDLSGHEFSPIRFEGMKLRRDGRTVFSADGGWFKFQDLPDAPRPAAKAAQRLVQMRQIAERFTVIDIFGRFENDVQHYNLRLMPQPVYRYEETEGKIDGGMFVFAQGTNPEAVLLVEALGEGEKPGWRYGFAPTTTYELTAHLGGEEGPVVWSKPRYLPFDAPTGPYYAAFYPPSLDDISLKGLMPDRKAKAEPSGKE